MVGTMSGQEHTSNLCVVRPRRRSCGFSLTESLVACSVATTLAGLAIPPMNNMLHDLRMQSAVGSFVSALHLARSEAIKRNGRAVLCKSADGQACSASGDWSQGWLVFHDGNNNAAFDEGEAMIGQHGAMPSGLRLSGNLPVSRYVSYSATGTAKLTSGAFQAGTFTVCPAKTHQSAVRQIVLSPTGRPRTRAGLADDCG